MKAIQKTFLQKLNNLHIGTKLSFIVLFAALLPITFMAIFFSEKAYSMILADTLRSKQERISQEIPAINKKLSAVASCVDKLKTQAFYKTIFLQESFSGSEAPYPKDAATDFMNYVNKLTSESPVNAIRLYMDLPASHPLVSSEETGEVIKPMDSVRGSYWHGIFAGTTFDELFCPSFYLSATEQKNLGDIAYIVPVRYRHNRKQVPCYLALYFSSDILLDIIKSDRDNDGSVSYIITDRDATVVSTDPRLSGIYHQNYSDIYQYLFSSNNYLEKDVLGEKIYLTFKTLDRPKWFLVNVVPRSSIIRETAFNVLEFALIAFIILALSLFLTVRLAGSIGRRISEVIGAMHRIREGNLVPLEEPEVHDELGDLISTYNYMTRKQKDLTDNLQQVADELRIAEVNALQAQINPHFLYNTLDTIHWMAVAGRTTEISETVRELSRFYKLTLGKDMTNTTIEKEAEHASLYVDLQNIRFNNAIDFIIDLPDELNPLPIPRLTLQPIVENAILHGIREKDSQSGCIILTGWTEEDAVCLLISDDGVGISEDYLPKILSQEGSNPSTRGTNIAIYNVHHRLQLLYGPDYGLSYESTPGQGTEVKIRLPLETTSLETEPVEEADQLREEFHPVNYSEDNSGD